MIVCISVHVHVFKHFFRAQELSPDFSKIRALVTHNGDVHWEPGSILSTTCDIDIRYFPFDEQECIIEIGKPPHVSDE